MQDDVAVLEVLQASNFCAGLDQAALADSFGLLQTLFGEINCKVPGCPL